MSTSTAPVAAVATGLRVTGLHAAHGRTEVLHGVDLEVPARCLASVVGPSGCGKTTLLRAIAGFHQPTGGRVELAGQLLDEPPGTHRPAHKRRVGYIPQDTALFPHLTVAANIGFGLPRARRAQKVREMLELIDLDGYADRHPHQLSGGQQQRVALARALAPGPDLLLLDEPFSALDAGLRARVRSDVAALLRRTGTTAVLVTHDAQEALAFADLVAIMNSGVIVQSGAPEELYSQPIDSDVARALGDANLLRASPRGGQVETALGLLRPQSPSLPEGETFTVLVRPRQLEVTLKAAADSRPGHVIRSEFSGDDCRLELAVEGLSSPLIAHFAHHLELGSVAHVAVAGPVHTMSAAFAGSAGPD